MNKEITQAFLLNLETKLVGNNYKTLGLYSFGSNFLLVELPYFKDNPNPKLLGDIANVHYLCRITESNPFEVFFQPVLHSPLTLTNPKIERLTQAESFEQTATALLRSYSESSEFCDSAFDIDDILKISDKKQDFSEDKIKEFSQLISKQYIPCSSLVIKNNKFHGLQFFFSQKKGIVSVSSLLPYITRNPQKVLD